MNKPKFKVGDRVRGIKNPHPFSNLITGKLGTIKRVFENCYAVEFDNNINSHDCDGYAKMEHGLWCNDEMLECVCNSKIVITTDGKITTAKMYDGKTFIKSANAVCSADDEFDFNIGAMVAMERLTGQLESNLEVEEHFYNGKVVCVSSGCYETAFTVGKIYEITEGELKAESCAYLTEIKKVSEIDEHFKREGVNFLEIVE